MSLVNMGGIVQKNQTASLSYPGYPGEKYNYYYIQGNTAHPHATLLGLTPCDPLSTKVIHYPLIIFESKPQPRYHF